MKQGAFDQSLIVYGSDLIDQQVRVLFQQPLSGDPDPQRLSVIDQIRRQGDYNGRGMPGFQKRFVLENQNGSDLARFSAASRI
jgi:hypothetical protein